MTEDQTDCKTGQDTLTVTTTTSTGLSTSSLNTVDLSNCTTSANINLEMGVEDATVKFSNYYNQMVDPMEKHTSAILMDHCYSRPWNWRPESNFLRPTKTLFISKPNLSKRKSKNPLAPVQECEDVLDVESVPSDPPVIYDPPKAKFLMEECERHAGFARVDQGNEDWEETISRVSWTSTQNRLFNGMVSILNSDHMARLAHSGAYNEPILRRTVIDKSVKRMRKLMASVSWEPRLTQWLHQVLIDNLSTQYLAAYLDILQTLKSKLPTFVDKMMYGPNLTGRLGVLSNESLFPLLKRSWDPVAASLMQDKPKKLPGNPIIVIVPSAPNFQSSNQSKRILKWINLLSSLATVVTVHANIGTAGSRMTMLNCMDQMLATTRGKLQELRADYPGRNIILAGFNAGAALALQIAQVEPAVCVLCLGFSLLTAEGKRGDPDDNLLELQCPVLFVIGQCSNTSLQEDMEDLRERMRVETGLIVVGSADDYLRVSKKKKRSEGITQSVVDRFIVDEVGEFVSGILLSPGPPQLRQSPMHISADAANVKRPKVERKRNNSNGSSIDSEPPSPTPRITRPVGRPPGSKSKTKLEAKWAAQVAQGTLGSPSPSNSPPPLLTPITPDTSSTDSSSLTERSFPNLAPPIEPTKIFRPLSNVPGTDKTKKPSITSPTKAFNTSTAKRFRAMGLTKRSVLTGSTLSHLLQGNYKTIPGLQGRTSSSTGIKVLENVTVNTGASAKLISSSGKTIDLSKITVLNSINSTKPGTSLTNVVLMPDGKLKTVGPAVKSSGTINTLTSGNKTSSTIHSTTTATIPTSRVAKYITSKKQLLGNKPLKQPKKSSCVSSPLASNLPPPTNLTSQDIMDLPIIFADDNQIIPDTNTIQPELLTPPPSHTLKTTNPTSTGKVVFLNKHVSYQNAGNVIISQSSLKKPTVTLANKAPSSTVKYTKIILSKRPAAEDTKSANSSIIAKISNLSPEISVKKVESPGPLPEPFDLEKELVATTVPKPSFRKLDAKNITIVSGKNSESAKNEALLPRPLQTILNEALAKRSAEMAKLIDDETDPDYIPPKNMKLDKS